MEKIAKTTISNKIVELAKKTISMFLMLAIIFNVVIPKAQWLKNNFAIALNCVCEVQTNFYDKYADSVVSVTNGIASNIINVLNKAGLCGDKISNSKEEAATGSKKDKQEPINTSAENGIIIENNISNENTINLLKSKTTGLAYTSNYNEQIQYYNDGLISSNKETNNIGILFFILFSILVVRIKDTIAIIINNKKINRKEPTWLR